MIKICTQKNTSFSGNKFFFTINLSKKKNDKIIGKNLQQKNYRRITLLITVCQYCFFVEIVDRNGYQDLFARYKTAVI